MTKRIKAAPRKTKPASRTPTAGKAKARKATARGRHRKQPKPEFPDLDTGDESEADDHTQTEQTLEGEEPKPEEEPTSKPHSQPSDRFKRDPWNSHRENERARCNDSEKATKRAQAPLSALLPKQRYDQWSSVCDSFFAAPLSSVDHFPRPQGLGKCTEKGVRCMMGEKLDFCHHQLKEFLMGDGAYGMAWLKKERVR